MASSFLNRVFIIANGLHVGLYRLSSGQFANRIAGLPVLLMTTTGRRSGRPLTNPVVLIREGQDYWVSATNGGGDRHPDWYFNLRNKAEASIQIGDRVFKVNATITDGEERAHLYEEFKAASSNFVKYEKGVSRVIPVIRLTPASDNR